MRSKGQGQRAANAHKTRTSRQNSDDGAQVDGRRQLSASQGDSFLRRMFHFLFGRDTGDALNRALIRNMRQKGGSGWEWDYGEWWWYG